ncbi:calcium-binding protein [Nocardioides sp. NPDC126508]
MVLLTGRTLLAGIVAMAASATVLVASPASAATTSTGVRCTIVGTSGGDVLRGTSHRDVICGRGGGDIIYAKGGDDLVDAGSGGDHVYADSGADKVLAGSGEDWIHGGGGSDSLNGGTGQDNIWGEDGGDVISGGDHFDVISGGAGADRIYGGAAGDNISGGTSADAISGGTGSDSISGGDGNDSISGGDGNDSISGNYGDDQLHGNNHLDTVNGGPGHDRLWGESGDDTLNGGDGNDKLSGGSGLDDVHGNAGTNTCYYDIYDILSGCGYDKAPPQIVSVSATPSTVDTTTADAKVRVRVHATDDLSGVKRIQGHFMAVSVNGSIYMPTMSLASGGTRDGWWEYVLTVPRWAPAGPMELQLWVTDRHGREVGLTRDILTVTNTDPDSDAPTVSISALTPTSIDVRTASKTVKVSARVRDAKSGVDSVSICLTRSGTPAPSDPFYMAVACEESVTRTSGTVRDGVWTTYLTIPKGSVGGVYNVDVYVEDRIGNVADWMGPEAYAQFVNSGSSWPVEVYELDAAMSRLQVQGTAQ